MATISDVAREAGVSRSTVSYALSGKRTISRETRERIERAIAALGFTVNAGARALATSQTMVLGLLLQFHKDEFAPAMLQYVLPISDTARELGYDILMVTEADGPAALTRITGSGMVDGVVLLDVTHRDPRLEALRAAAQPGALVGLPGDTEGLDVFDLDFGEAARMLVDHLYGLGHREIVLISPPKHVFDRGGAYGWRFRDAALERAARYGIQIFPYYGESQQPAISRSLHAVLDARPEASALIVHNDASIAALPSVLMERGVTAPDDLSVVSLYSKDFGRSFSLPYTAIETSPDALGRQAVQQLVRRILNPEATGAPVTRFIAPELVNRGSTH
ncbi:LacI family DNA-binding transcriptional regulator [Leifsonia sp. Root112D2]|jgi:DNA-binding LacI/PurR family transcriptional regulator|uniref:LacI family DNA-binding transcriptional regulator n=1 Tax=Leifsonia sp. Root112D2 TaxID=1736426 RepID=UPI0006FD2310|nr:LacI family DNA-binding transcriptional regulator [Leifsonia sp. Root112D2]KQV06674.1 transcriptional regulator [Leifsonia sp. Root112D2]